jgi:hypothetical protein
MEATMSRLVFSAGLCALALAACAATDAPPPPTAGGTCDAAPAQFAVGQPYEASLAERARAASGSRLVRRMEPGMAYTMEFNALRLNLVTDGSGRVTAARCG